jgi:hypothetical protein
MISVIAVAPKVIRRDKLVAGMKNPIRDSLGGGIRFARHVRVIMIQMVNHMKNVQIQRNKQSNYHRALISKIFRNYSQLVIAQRLSTIVIAIS